MFFPHKSSINSLKQEGYANIFQVKSLTDRHKMPPTALQSRFSVHCAQEASSFAHHAVNLILDYDWPQHRSDVTNHALK